MILELSEEGRDYMFKLWSIQDDPHEDMGVRGSGLTEVQDEDLTALVMYATS